MGGGDRQADKVGAGGIVGVDGILLCGGVSVTEVPQPAVDVAGGGVGGVHEGVKEARGCGGSLKQCLTALCLHRGIVEQEHCGECCEKVESLHFVLNFCFTSDLIPRATFS